MCGIFVCPKQRHGCQCLGSLTCAQMLMHAIAHEGCTDTVKRVCTGSLILREKSLAAPGEANRPQRHAGLTLYQLSYIPTPKRIGHKPDLKKKNRSHDSYLSVTTNNHQPRCRRYHPYPHHHHTTTIDTATINIGL